MAFRIKKPMMHWLVVSAFLFFPLLGGLACTSDSNDCEEYCGAINRSNSYGYCYIEYYPSQPSGQQFLNDQCYVPQTEQELLALQEDWPFMGPCPNSDNPLGGDTDGDQEMEAIEQEDTEQDDTELETDGESKHNNNAPLAGFLGNSGIVRFKRNLVEANNCEFYEIYNPSDRTECERVCSVMTDGNTMPADFKLCLNGVTRRDEMLTCQAQLQRALQLQEK